MLFKNPHTCVFGLDNNNNNNIYIVGKIKYLGINLILILLFLF